MFRLAVVNPGKKRSKRRKARKHNAKNTFKKRKVNSMKKKTVKRHHRHARKANPAKRHIRRHARKSNPAKKHIRRHARRRNPSTALSMPKFDLETTGITLAITATGFIGNSIIKGTISPLIPGYTSLTGLGIVAADTAVAVGIPFALAFVLPMLGMKKATAIRVSTALGVGMLTNVIARVTSEVMSGQTISSRIQRKIPGMGSIVTSIPAARSYGLAKGMGAGITAKNIFNTIPSYVS
jgi:hypothetical protein